MLPKHGLVCIPGIEAWGEANPSFFVQKLRQNLNDFPRGSVRRKSRNRQAKQEWKDFQQIHAEKLQI
jgi:hypothetical protein